MEAQESERETALREVLEETGLTVTLLPDFRTVDEHLLPGKPNTIKQVVYFLAFYENQTPVYQKEELMSAALYAFDEALPLFQFDSSRQILSQAHAWLTQQKR